MNCVQCGSELVERVTYRPNGWIKQRRTPTKFCSLTCVGLWNSARQAEKARGRYIDKHGYVIVTARKGDNGYQQPEHRMVMEGLLGRKLTRRETVHHKDGDRTNNAPSNLELWASRHGRGQRVDDQDIWSGMVPPYQNNALGSF